jgi:hypothetical protein
MLRTWSNKFGLDATYRCGAVNVPVNVKEGDTSNVGIGWEDYFNRYNICVIV